MSMITFTTLPHSYFPNNYLRSNERASSLKTFASGTLPAPPKEPPVSCGLGGYCIKATCDIWDETGDVIGTIEGYDKRDNIVDRVENKCKYTRNRRRGEKCSEPTLTLLPPRDGLECSGQIYHFQFVKGVKKLV